MTSNPQRRPAAAPCSARARAYSARGLAPALALALALALAPSAAAPAAAAAAATEILTFGTEAVDELYLAGVRTEGSFQYHASGVAGELLADPDRPEYGNPPASLVTAYNGDGPTVGDFVGITAIGGGGGGGGDGAFTFDSIDFRTIFAADSMDVSLTGSLAGSPVGVLNLTTSTTTFQTVAGFAGEIDLLRITLTAAGLGADNAMILDNIHLTPVPEPSSAAAITAAVVSLSLRRRQRAAPGKDPLV